MRNSRERRDDRKMPSIYRRLSRRNSYTLSRYRSTFARMASAHPRAEKLRIKIPRRSHEWLHAPKQHGGSIEVETQPGEFTEIKVTLPRSVALLPERS